jgi:integrase
MLTGCKWISRIVSKNVVPIAGGYSGDDLADFIEVGLYTGLRISDIATFDSSRITDSGEVNVRALKNGRWVSVWIPDWLRDRIEWRAQRYGRKIFPTNTNGLDSACELWRQRLNRLWKITGPWERRPTPHRLRHTFIRLLLERGLPLAMVAELAGDTEQVIQRHYSSFVPSRQKAISDAMRAAFANAPRFHR